ncbi:hypothetical protein B7P43_G15879 [Cryptotermes secundus]|uniref:Uncharacterized protein n=1 Tax=Cryptotermes secundus TaxID=105785 RepID=A0A2J7R6U0_9NEOP|nr:spermatogenesis-associated protein 7 isoform X1 [Cryptotermes secundus]XP_023704843.1 spermatogenesis-associated protein 7 isoform X1 [Cryptotermes secundus]XP_023704844.1 spermatogenesis-associated protein 7 isoform X1 [Cryptotermes secundus]PNF36552.1 hypothetical protein B7P43_G15879 [Cryptotermes secundus]PNF36553.1 hypothetical protein B7P43_G15879 [Cryptotermes secundus]
MKPLSCVGGNMCQPSVRNHLLYTHMSNHYRRIYSAKSTVDTAPPHGAIRRQQPHTSLCSPKKCELGLADIIASDKKNSPRTYTGHTWTQTELLSQARRVASHKQQRECLEGEQERNRGWTSVKKESWSYCKRAPDIMDQHAHSFKLPDRAFKPRILKTDVQSRLRDLRVYHPPSRKGRPRDYSELQVRKHKQQRPEDQQSEEEAASGGMPARCSDLCDPQKHVSSKESSRDSAYNGGVSSGTASRGLSPIAMCPIVLAGRPTAHKSLPAKTKEDAVYMKFVHDITEDVLARGIYSDRGLRQLFQRHIADNEGQLSLDRMQDEVARLCEQLGIPQPDKRGCGSELLHLAWSKKSHYRILSGVKDVEQGRTFSLEASECMQKVRNIPCQTLQGSLADESCADVGGFEEPEPTPSVGLPYTLSCETSEIPVTD